MFNHDDTTKRKEQEITEATEIALFVVFAVSCSVWAVELALKTETPPPLFAFSPLSIFRDENGEDLRRCSD
jgi:hypothetical protein